MTETVYFIAGASRGIGLEFLIQLHRQPSNIIFAGVRNPSSLQAHFSSPPSNLHILKCDVTSDEDVSNCIHTISQTPFKRVDILIHNAGIDNYLSIRDTSTDQFRYVLETNLISPLRVIRDSSL